MWMMLGALMSAVPAMAPDEIARNSAIVRQTIVEINSGSITSKQRASLKRRCDKGRRMTLREVIICDTATLPLPIQLNLETESTLADEREFYSKQAQRKEVPMSQCPEVGPGDLVNVDDHSKGDSRPSKMKCLVDGFGVAHPTSTKD